METHRADTPPARLKPLAAVTLNQWLDRHGYVMPAAVVLAVVIGSLVG